MCIYSRDCYGQRTPNICPIHLLYGVEVFDSPLIWHSFLERVGRSLGVESGHHLYVAEVLYVKRCPVWRGVLNGSSDYPGMMEYHCLRYSSNCPHPVCTTVLPSCSYCYSTRSPAGQFAQAGPTPVTSRPLVVLYCILHCTIQCALLLFIPLSLSLHPLTVTSRPLVGTPCTRS